MATVSTYGTYQFTWTETNGSCSDAATITVDYYAPVTANAGTDDEVCGLIIDLNATLSTGSGVWSGPAGISFDDPASPTAQATAPSYGTYVLTWTETNGTCTGADQVQVTYYKEPLANAGTGGDECDLNFLLSAVPSTGAGVWTQTAGPGTSMFNNAASPNATVTVTEYGSYEFTWTETNGVCSDAAAVVVNFFAQPVADAGTDSEECAMFHTMDAVFSLTGTTGTWTQISGPGTSEFSDPASPVSDVSVDAYGTYVYEWNEQNNVCWGTDRVTIRYNQPAQVLSVDNDGAVYCEPESIQVSGTIGGGATSGSWSLVSGGSGTLTVSSLQGSQVIATYFPAAGEFGPLEFALTTNDPDGSGPCSAVSAPLTINISESPKVNAGPDIAVCEDAGSVAMAGVLSGSAATVQWSGGMGSFDDPASPTAVYTWDPSEIGTTVTLTLTAFDPDGAGPCIEVADVVNVTINPLPVVNFFNLPAVTDEGAPPIVLVGNRIGGLFTIAPGSGLGTTYIEDNQDKVVFDPGSATVATTNYVTYTYTDPNGCTNSITKSVLVNEVTSVDFTIQGAVTNTDDQLQICNGNGEVALIGFPPVAEGYPVTEFTSPTAGLISNPSANTWLFNTNVAPGLYEVRYTFTNEFNATSNLIRQVKVVGTPIADFQNLNACAEQAIDFEDISTLEAGPFPTSIIAWNWNFGDSEATPTTSSTGPATSTVYQNGGTKNVTMTVTTDFGCTSTISKNIVLGEAPEPDFIWTDICQSESTSFENRTSDISSFAWNFGDGATSTQENPQHQFGSSGYYDVNLSVVSNSGCSGDTTKQVYILPYIDIAVTQNNEYFEDFNTDDGNWVPGSLVFGNPVSWVYGTPSGSFLNSDNPAWYTGANGGDPDGQGYYNLEQSALNGPCINIDALERPMIAFDLSYSTQDDFDGAVLQFGYEDPLTGDLVWENVGERNRGVNWFNSQGIIARPGDETSNFNEGDQGWSGESSLNWVSSRYSLDALKGAGTIRVRLAFASDGSQPNIGTFNGIGIDNIFIGEKKRNVLVEFFADNGFENSNSFNTSLNNLKQNPDVDVFNAIQYHLNQSGLDPFHAENTQDPLARGLFYSVSTAPRFVLDGAVLPSTLEDNLSENKIDQRSLLDPLFRIDIDTLASAQGVINFQVTLEALTDIDQPVVLHTALTETRSSQAGSEYRNILKKLFYGGAGLDIPDIWTAGQTATYEVNYVIDVEIEETEKLELFAFVQNKVDYSIYQSVSTAAPVKDNNALVTSVGDDLKDKSQHISLYPNPVNGVLNFYLPDHLYGTYGYQLIDQRGVTMLQGNMDFVDDRFSLDTWDLANGVYYVIITLNDEPVTQRKIVVMNRR